ncbi:hypothetical protein F0235_04975 [Vibrio splendidus]|uniref:hypothetical protein n=1 Tax=Vibrio splendidus TaxID=29497 RepID=UPI00148C5D0A|nr:hypothetical protein [Vibrio splendidus]NOI89793.1 hypothetical protein [Vibrio splendidus]
MFNLFGRFCKSVGCVVGEEVNTINESLDQKLRIQRATRELRIAKAVAIEEIQLIDAYIDWLEIKKKMTKDQVDFVEGSFDTTSVTPFKYKSMSIEELLIAKRSKEGSIHQLELNIEQRSNTN